MRSKLISTLSALAMITTMFITSCDKEGDEYAPTPPITIPEEFTDFSIESGAVNEEVKFTATMDWKVTLEETTKAAPSWVRVSPMSGKPGSVTLKVDVEENTVEEERSSIVKINAGGEEYEITLIQAAGKPILVAEVTLNKSTLSLVEGQSETLTATIAPENAANRNVTWESSNTEVATVADGKVTAVKAGDAVVTVTTEDGAKTATCEVKVSAKVIEVTDVDLNKTSLSLDEGASETLVATINPENATNNNVTWSSSDTAVATVVDGKVIAVKAGEATITVTTEDGAKRATCAVVVTARVSSVTLNKTSLPLDEGVSETLIATINPDNATNKKVTWSSSNTAVATVSDGKVTAVKAGDAIITVTTEDGAKRATCAVIVKAKVIAVTAVALNKSTLSLVEGKSATLTATVNPSNATNKNVTWKSSNTAAATVVDGVVTAVEAGEAIITVTTEDGCKTDTCAITVKAAGALGDIVTEEW